MCLFTSCQSGYIRLWDGIRQPGLYRYPPNTLCGIFTTHPEVVKFSSDHALEVELYHAAANRRLTLAITYKYVNMGEFRHVLYTSFTYCTFLHCADSIWKATSTYSYLPYYMCICLPL